MGFWDGYAIGLLTTIGGMAFGMFLTLWFMRKVRDDLLEAIRMQEEGPDAES